MKKALLFIAAAAAWSIAAMMPAEGSPVGDYVAWLAWLLGAGYVAVMSVVTAQRWHREEESRR